jgi:hypothetical protein
MYAQEVVSEGAGTRRFLSGPLEPGFAMLTTPTCSMSAQGNAAGYAHFVRTLVPIVSLAEIVEENVLNEDQLREARKHDGLLNYMYLPAHKESGMPVSLALLYITITLDHELLVATSKRTTQLALQGAQQLQRKLVIFNANIPIDRKYFQPEMA